ncbi:MAG: hypothetical protein ABEH64_11565 [Salinirussus sp.]
METLTAQARDSCKVYPVQLASGGAADRTVDERRDPELVEHLRPMLGNIGIENVTNIDLVIVLGIEQADCALFVVAVLERETPFLIVDEPHDQ